MAPFEKPEHANVLVNIVALILFVFMTGFVIHAEYHRNNLDDGKLDSMIEKINSLQETVSRIENDNKIIESSVDRLSNSK